MANNAFDAMNESAGSDMYLTGGAITVSEYEQNMSPDDQIEYENTLMGLFQTAYQNDTLLQKYPNVSFKHWLSTIDNEDWSVKANNYAESRETAHMGSEGNWRDIKGEGSDFTYSGDQAGTQENQVWTVEQPEQFNQNEQIYLLQRLSHLHTGLVEDLVTIVEPLVQNKQYNEPYGAYNAMTPKEGQMGREEYTQFREQGSQPLPPE